MQRPSRPDQRSPTYASNLGYWPGDTHTVMYFDGQPWVLPRQDVCV